jgi:hypothetical protein
VLADGSVVRADGPLLSPPGWVSARSASSPRSCCRRAGVPAGADERPEPLDDVSTASTTWSAAHDHAELYWFPHTSTALVKRNDRVDGPPARCRRGARRIEDECSATGLYDLTCGSGRVPAVVPP